MTDGMKAIFEDSRILAEDAVLELNAAIARHRKYDTRESLWAVKRHCWETQKAIQEYQSRCMRDGMEAVVGGASA